MAIIETLTVELGSSIAKAILKVWLKDNSIASDITSDLLGLLKGKTQDVLAQQRAKRQFEAIGEKVAENLLPLFEAENSKVEEGAQIAIAMGISKILNNSKIDTALLAQEDIDPARLLSYLQELHPDRIQDLSKSESEFFERVLSEICQNIVDIASELPAFTERTLSEILKRENELLQKADVILEEVQRIRLSSERLDSTAQSSLFETEYRRAMVRKLDEIELFGADVSRASRRHRLSVAYVTLSVEEIIAHGEERDDEENEETEAAETNLETTVSVDKIILEHPRLFIRGDAGSGKTTLLQWVAVRAASSTFEGSLSFLNDYTPFFIRLRQCVDRGLPAPQEFPELTVSSIADSMPKGWVHERLKSGKALILVDGLDEVSQIKREEVRTWLRELVSNFPDVRYILSSRPPAANEGWLFPEGFQDAMMQSMTLQDIFDFVDHWHDAVKDALQDEMEKMELDPLAKNLKNVIQTNRSIYNLATTPLLCSMISALHRDRRRQLPKDRVELYEACTYMLLERREIERQIDYSDYPGLTYRQKCALLQGFAYWLMKNGWSAVDLDRLDTHFESKLKNMEGLSKTTGKDIRRLFVERSGMLREPVKGTVHFAHRTFQEFLAAQAALDEGDVGVLINKASDDQWKEVVILAAGLANHKVREELIKKIIARGDAERRRRHQLHLLAVACLETSVTLSPEVKQDIELRLSQMTPPKNITEAREWASAGELAITYLSKGAHSKAVVSAACVRALTLIGGELSLRALKEFAMDSRQTVINELVRGVDYFDKEEYAKTVFSSNSLFAKRFERVMTLDIVKHLSFLRKLTLDSPLPYNWKPPSDSAHVYYAEQEKRIVSDLHPLSQLENLEFLRIENCTKISSLEPLRLLIKLKELYLLGVNSEIDLSPLGDLELLEKIVIVGDVANIDFIANLPNLKSIKLIDSPLLDNLEPLAGLVNINEIALDNCEALSSLHSLAKLVKLKHLSVRNCSKINDIGIIASLPEIETLNFSRCELLEDISPLASNPTLTSLNLSGCWRLSDITPLMTAGSLTELSIAGCNQIENIDCLSRNTKLKYLNLAGCYKLKNLAPVSLLLDLETLSLSYCSQISNLQPLENLQKLKILDLSFCNSIVDVTPLEKMESLILLSFAGNEAIKVVNLDALPERLRAINIYGCKGLDLKLLSESKHIEKMVWGMYEYFYPAQYIHSDDTISSRHEAQDKDRTKMLRRIFQSMVVKEANHGIVLSFFSAFTDRRFRRMPYRAYYEIRNLDSAVNLVDDLLTAGKQLSIKSDK